MQEKKSLFILTTLMLPLLLLMGAISWGLIYAGFYLAGFGIAGICLSAVLTVIASALVIYGKKYSQQTLGLGQEYRSAFSAKDFSLAGKKYQEALMHMVHPGMPRFLNMAAIISMLFGSLATFVGIS